MESGDDNHYIEHLQYFETNYDITSQLACGKDGTIILLAEHRNKKSGFKVAVKCISKAVGPSQSKREERLVNEINILRALDHINIIKFYHLFETTTDFRICIEFCGGGDIFRKIVDDKVTYTEADIRAVAQSVLSALEHCHNKGIVHRDIKPDNIILQSTQSLTAVKLIDFDYAAHESTIASCVQYIVGTTGFIAPEIYKYKYNRAVDLWSLGVVVYILLFGCYPISPLDDGKLMLGTYSFPKESETPASERAKNFISQLMCFDPNNRLTATTAQRHDWLTAPSPTLSSHKYDYKRILCFNARRKFRSIIHVLVAFLKLHRRCSVTAAVRAPSTAVPTGTGEGFVSSLSTLARQLSTNQQGLSVLRQASGEYERSTSELVATEPPSIAVSNETNLSRFDTFSFSFSQSLSPSPSPSVSSLSPASSSGASLHPLQRALSFTDPVYVEYHNQQTQQHQRSPLPAMAIQSLPSPINGIGFQQEVSSTSLLALQQHMLAKEIAKAEEIMKAVELGIVSPEIGKLQAELLRVYLDISTKMAQKLQTSQR